MRVVVAGELPREAHNAPLHLISASPDLVGFGQGAYQQRSEDTSQLLGQLFERFRKEGFAMSYTMEDFKRDYIKEHFPNLTPEERREILQSLSPEEQCEALERLPPKRLEKVLRLLEAQQCRVILQSLPPRERREILQSLPPEEQQEVLRSLPPEKRLAGLSAEQIRQYLDQLTAGRPAGPRKPRRKK